MPTPVPDGTGTVDIAVVVVVAAGACVSTLAEALLDSLLLLLFWFWRRGLMPGDLSGMFGHLRGYKYRKVKVS